MDHIDLYYVHVDDRATPLEETLQTLPARWCLARMAAQRSPRVLPLIGTTKVSRYREAAQALDLELTAGQLTALDGA